MRRLIAIVVALPLAACSIGPSTPEPGADDCAAFEAPAFEAAPTFSGGDAFAHVLNIVCDFEADPPAIRDRSPGTPGREATARYLASVLADHGWSVSAEDFSGADYLALDRGTVSRYSDPDACPPGSLDRLRGLRFENVVAERGGGPDLWILMAHYEAKAAASRDADPSSRDSPVPGANDSASGVGVWLEAARLIPAHESATFRVLLVDGEDGFQDCHPLAGSIFHARSMSEAERARVRGVLLLDMVGDPEAGFCYSHNDEMLRQAVADAAAAVGFAPLADAPDCAIVDDHTAFADVGMPALDLIDLRGGSFPPYWHTLGDVPSRLSPATLGSVGEVMLRAIERLAAKGT